MEKNGIEMERKECIKNYSKDLVRYANRMETADIAALPENVQNMIILFLARWTAERKEKVQIPLDEFKKRMNLSKQRNSYIKRLTEASFGASRITINFPDGSFCVTSFITAMGFHNDSDPQKSYVYARANPEFMPIFTELKERYTQFMAETYIRIKGIYAKNLFRLFAKNFKGHFVMSREEFLFAMGVPKSYRISQVNQIVEKAAMELDNKKIYKNICCTQHIGTGKGNPVESFEFSYEPGAELPDISKKQKSPNGSFFKEPSTLQTEEKPVEKPFESLAQDKLVTPNELRCPYDNDLIIERSDKAGQKFWGHKSYKDHKDCPLKNKNTIEEMQIAINEANQRISAKKAKDDVKSLLAQALAELREEYPDGMPSERQDICMPSIDDIQRALNGGFSNNDIAQKMEEIKTRGNVK